jgi:glutathione S-transferase
MADTDAPPPTPRPVNRTETDNMLKLHGLLISNYHNMVKHVLQLKGVPFEELQVIPGTDPAYLDKSPAGKVPCLETEHGCLAETNVILDYLEATYPQPALSPADVWGRAKMKELMKMTELYIELPARRLMPVLMMGATLDENTAKEARATLEKGAAAIRRLAKFQPYLLGEQKTLADIFLRYSLGLAKSAGPSLLDFDINKAIPELAAWEERMADCPVAKGIDAVVAEEMPKFMAMMKKAQG